MTNLFKVAFVEIEIPTPFAAQISKRYVRCLQLREVQNRPTPSYMQPVILPLNAQEDMYWNNTPHLSIPMYVPTRQHFSQHLVRFTYDAYRIRQARLDLSSGINGLSQTLLVSIVRILCLAFGGDSG